MIPIYRSTLTRLDLSSVLSYMVDNALEGESAGQLLVKELVSMAQYSGGYAFRSPFDAVVSVMEIMEAQDILLPVLAPYVLKDRLEALGKSIQLYDVDIETMSPIIHQNTHIEYKPNMLRLGMRYFGGVVYDDTKLPTEFLDIPKIELTWSLDKTQFEQASNIKQKKDDSSDKSRYETKNRPEFKIFLLEKNTLCTAGGGAVLLCAEKAHANKLKAHTKHWDSWFPLTDLNAGLALAQLKQVDEFVSRILKITPLYKQAIERTRHSILSLVLYKEAVPQNFPILISARVTDVMKFIRKQEIEYDSPFQKSILGMMLESTTSDKVALTQLYSHGTKFVTNVIRVPLYSALDNEEVSTITRVISTLP